MANVSQSRPTQDHRAERLITPDRRRERFRGNPRMANMYRTWDRMAEDKRATVLAEAQHLINKLDAGSSF